MFSWLILWAHVVAFTHQASGRGQLRPYFCRQLLHHSTFTFGLLLAREVRCRPHQFSMRRWSSEPGVIRKSGNKDEAEVEAGWGYLINSSWAGRAGHSQPQSGDICISMIGVCCISTLSAIYLHPNLQPSHNDSSGVDIMVILMMELWWLFTLHIIRVFHCPATM